MNGSRLANDGDGGNVNRRECREGVAPENGATVAFHGTEGKEDDGETRDGVRQRKGRGNGQTEKKTGQRDGQAGHHRHSRGIEHGRHARAHHAFDFPMNPAPVGHHALQRRVGKRAVQNESRQPRAVAEGDPDAAEHDGEAKRNGNPRNGHRSQKWEAKQDNNHLQSSALQGLHHFPNSHRLAICLAKEPFEGIGKAFRGLCGGEGGHEGRNKTRDRRNGK